MIYNVPNPPPPEKEIKKKTVQENKTHVITQLIRKSGLGS